MAHDHMKGMILVKNQAFVCCNGKGMLPPRYKKIQLLLMRFLHFLDVSNGRNKDDWVHDDALVPTKGTWFVARISEKYNDPSVAVNETTQIVSKAFSSFFDIPFTSGFKI